MSVTFRITNLLSFLLFSGISGASEVQTEIKQMLNFFAEEWNEGDLESIRGRFHRDFILVTSDGIRNRQQRLDELGDVIAIGKDRGVLSFSEIEVKPLKEDYAVAYGRSRLKFKDGTELGSMFSSIYVNTPFGWKVILTHE